jgi:DNA-binding MarR family transcriptional regulator
MKKLGEDQELFNIFNRKIYAPILSILYEEYLEDERGKRIFKKINKQVEDDIRETLKKNDGQEYYTLAEKGVLMAGFFEYIELLSRYDILDVLYKRLSQPHEKILDELSEEHGYMISTIIKLESQIDQHLPTLISPLEEQILCSMYRRGKFSQEEIREFPKGKYHRNSVYNALKRMQKKGLVMNTGKGYVHYLLTEIGEKQAKWLIVRVGERDF